MTPLQLLDEIEQLVENGRGGFGGTKAINNAEFLSKVEQLKATISSPSQPFLDELERLGKVSGGKNRVINEVEFFTTSQRFRAHLAPAPKPQKSIDPAIIQALDDIEVQVEKGTGGWLGKRFVDETAMLDKIQHLRSMLASTQTLQLTDELQQMVKRSRRWFGKSSISEEEFFTAIQRLRSCLGRE